MNSTSIESAYSKIFATLQISKLEIIENHPEIKKMALFRIASAYSDFEKSLCLQEEKDKKKMKDIQRHLRLNIALIMKCPYCPKTQKIKLFLCFLGGISNISRIHRFVQKSCIFIKKI